MEITQVVVLTTAMDTSVMEYNCYIMMGGAARAVVFGMGDILSGRSMLLRELSIQLVKLYLRGALILNFDGKT